MNAAFRTTLSGLGTDLADHATRLGTLEETVDGQTTRLDDLPTAAELQATQTTLAAKPWTAADTQLSTTLIEQQIVPLKAQVDALSGPSGAQVVTYVGNMNVVMDPSFKGLKQANPDVWTDALRGRGFEMQLDAYESYIDDATKQRLVVRLCATYTDGSGPDSALRPKNLFRLKRIKQGDPTYGSGVGPDGKQYEAGFVFITEGFVHTWSSNFLYHDDCGTWTAADAISCGRSWTDTCSIEVSHEAAMVMQVDAIFFEIGVQAKAPQ